MTVNDNLCIIVPHYGKIESLVKKIRNLNDKITSDRVKVIIQVDGGDDIKNSEIDSINSKNFIVNQSSKNEGLTWARHRALLNGLGLGLSLFMFSNSDDLFKNDLNQELVDKLITKSNDYVIQYFRVSENNYVEGEIDYFELYNHQKEDLLTIFKFNDINLYPKFKDEKYCPESLFFSNLVLASSSRCYIHEFILGNIIYSEEGLTNSYNNDFLLSNKQGFLSNAYQYLDLWENDLISLSFTKLKGIIDCIINLDEVDIRKFKKNFTKELIKSRLNSWIDNNNKFKIK
jgi:hypothetical protein